MLPDVTPYEFAAALDATVAELLRCAGPPRPPVDAFAIAGALGIVVARDQRQPGRARYVRLPAPGARGNQASILLRDDPRHERRQWAVAHELGEHLAAKVFARLAVDPRAACPGARETIANCLASRLLLPSQWLLRDARACDWDLPALKSQYATASHELLARRMLDDSAPLIVTICDQGQVTFRRSNLAGHCPRLAPAERRAWQRAHAAGVAAECVERGLRVRAWPVHEPLWQREILRTELSAAHEG